MKAEWKHRNLRQSILSRAVIAIIALATLLCVSNTAVAQGLQWMHLLSPGVGWVASSSQVFWTTDNGQHWKDITPPLHEAVTSVFFLDGSTGWVLLSKYEMPQPRFDLAITMDSGATWSVNRLPLPGQPDYPILVTQGYIQFTDDVHGWMNLSVESSSAYHSGLLFRTGDGGKDWTLLRGPGTTGELNFIDQRSGWILSPGGRELWVTHDGTATWTQVVLKPPAGTHPSDLAKYQLPLFWDDKHGVEVVRFYALPTAPDADAQGSQLLLFATSDGGRSWKSERPLSHLPTAGKSFATALADSTLLTVHPTGNSLTLRRTPLKNQADSAVETASAGSSAVISTSFASEQQGWALAATGNCSIGLLPCTHVLSTVDAGATWADITPGGKEPAIPLGKPIPLKWQRAGVLRSLAANELSVHLGFDSCPLYSPTQMQDLWSGSSYQDVGIYIGDFDHITCDAPPQGYIQCIQGGCPPQAWGIMPIWSAFQAPCACYSNSTSCPKPQNQMSSNTNTAYLQGQDAANDAITGLGNLGLSGEIAYLDLEQYNNGSGQPAYCLTAPQAYVSGWVSTLHANGQLAGVYGSPTDAWTWTQNPPDDVWFGKMDYRVTIWGMGYGTGDNLWPNNQRIHQFWTDTSITLNDGDYYALDRDVEDATIVANNLPKSSTLTPTQKSYIPCQTELDGINNYAALAGDFTQSTGDCGLCGLIDYYTATGGDKWVAVPLAGVMGGINNQCGAGGGCAYQSNMQNTAVGYQTPTLGRPANRRMMGIRRGHAMSVGVRGQDATCSSGSNDLCGVSMVQGQQASIFQCSQSGGGSGLSGVSDDPQFAGWFPDSSGMEHGFVSPDATGSNCFAFDPTGSIGTIAEGVNGDGQVVGSFTDSNNVTHGFIYNYGNGINPPPPTQIDYPGGGTNTELYGISNNGWILGWSDASGGTYFLYDENTDTYVPISTEDAFNGLNDNGYIVGATASGCNGNGTNGLILTTPLVP